MMKASDLRSKSISELKQELSGLRRKRLKLRFVKSAGELAGTHQMREARRDIARIETILTEKEGKADE